MSEKLPCILWALTFFLGLALVYPTSRARQKREPADKLAASPPAKKVYVVTFSYATRRDDIDALLKSLVDLTGDSYIPFSLPMNSPVQLDCEPVIQEASF